MKTYRWRWALVLLWMVVIYLFSAQSGEESGRLSGGITQWLVAHITPNWQALSEAAKEALLSNWRFIIRKAAHMTEFAVLGVLFVFAWSGVRTRSFARCGTLAAAGSFLVAVLDEAHQAFVPARGPSLRDVFIDFTGAVLGILFLWLVVRLVQNRRNKKESRAFS